MANANEILVGALRELNSFGRLSDDTQKSLDEVLGVKKEDEKATVKKDGK